MRQDRMIRRLAVVLGVAIGLGLAESAQATLLVRSDANGALVQDKNGLRDIVRVVGDGNAFRIFNQSTFDVFPFDLQPTCTAVAGDGRSVICPRNGAQLTIDLRAGDDFVLWDPASVPVNTLILGGAGADHLAGNNGRDEVNGGTGDDTLAGFGENDKVLGGDGADFMTGDNGADLLRGDADDDEMFGGIGDDRLEGGTGADTIVGESFNDSLDGGAGNDGLVGGSGIDSLFGGANDDVLFSKEEPGELKQADTVNCGFGFDSVFADLLDVVDAVTNKGGGTCEEVERSPVGETPNVVLPRKVLEVSSAGVAKVHARCPRRTTIGCRGSLSLRLASRGVRHPARTRYGIRAGRSGTVSVHLSAGETARVRAGARGILTSLEQGKLGLKTTTRSPRLR